VVATARYVGPALFEKYMERYLGIKTVGNLSLRELGFDENDDLHGYQPIDYYTLRSAFKALDMTPGQDVFLDYGSGLGRAVIYAATYPFRRTIGVELSEQLHRAAERNLENARPRLCCPVDLVCADAMDWDVPSDVTLVFLYNPFRGHVLQTVVGKITESARKYPRRLRVIYRRPDWVKDEINANGTFELIGELPFFAYLPETAQDKPETVRAEVYEVKL
jgi:hypothetical protein